MSWKTGIKPCRKSLIFDFFHTLLVFALSFTSVVEFLATGIDSARHPEPSPALLAGMGVRDLLFALVLYLVAARCTMRGLFFF